MGKSTEIVFAFTCSEIGVPRSELDLDTSLCHDLGVAGDDGSEFLANYCEKFEVELDKDFDIVAIFGEEASGNIFLMVFELITRHFERTAPRLTIGDLIAGADTGRLAMPK